MSRLTEEAPVKIIPAEQRSMTGTVGRGQALEFAISAALVLITLAAYWPCFNLPFTHFDDQDYVTQNRHVQAGLRADSIRWAFTTFDCGNWHPLTWLSLQLDCTLYGLKRPGGFHLTNVLLHTASTLLLFLTLGRMTGLIWRSSVIAALFALHPLNVEPVAWVAERKGVLSTFFWMVTLAAYLYYVRRPGIGRYLLVVLALLLGLMAKPMLVTLPGVLLLLDYWPLRRLPIADCRLQTGSFNRDPAGSGDSTYSPRPRFGGEGSGVRGKSGDPGLPQPPHPQPLSPEAGARGASVPAQHPGPAPPWVTVKPAGLTSAILEKLPLIAVVLAWGVVAYLTQHRIGALPSLDKYPLNVRIWNALLAYIGYVGKMLWPMNLAAYYPHPGTGVSVVKAAMAGLLLGILTALVLGRGRRWPYLAVGWLWYLVTLLPVIGLVQIGAHGMADRYGYVPLIGLFLLSTWGLADLTAAWRLPRVCLVILGTVVLVACFVLTRTQLGYWKSDKDLWEHTLAVTENNAMAHNNLGTYFDRQGMRVRAEREIAQAAVIEPTVGLFHHNLATLLRDRGWALEALAECRKAAALDPRQSLFHLTLGNLLRDQGEEEEALKELQEAARLNPDSPLTHGNLANILLDCDRRAEAAAEYQRALELDPGYSSPHLGLGKLLAEEQRLDEAVTEFRQAIELSPEKAVAHFNLAMALQGVGRLEAALEQYRKAEELGLKDAAPALSACKRLQALGSRLPGLLAGRDQPANNQERLGFAHLCSQPFEARYALAARLYSDAFRADPAWTDDLHAVDRADAAVAAAWAGCGQGKDAAGLDEQEKSHLRQQARHWLESELALWSERAPSGAPGRRAIVRQTLRSWQRNIGFAGVREPAALARLPEPERREWQKLWQAVEAERLRATDQGSRPPYREKGSS